MSRHRTRHTPHWYLALAGLVGAFLACALTIWAYYNEGLAATQVAFGSVTLIAAVLFATWFWGVYLVMTGLIPRRRVWYLAFHALLGSMAPLVYILYIGAELDTLGSQPVGEIGVALSAAGLVVLVVQFLSGRSVFARGWWRSAKR